MGEGNLKSKTPDSNTGNPSGGRPWYTAGFTRAVQALCLLKHRGW